MYKSGQFTRQDTSLLIKILKKKNAFQNSIRFILRHIRGKICKKKKNWLKFILLICNENKIFIFFLIINQK